MGFKDMWKRTETLEPEEEYIELDFPAEEGHRTVLVHVEKLMDIGDADRVARKVREGNILLVKMKDLRQKDVSELKRSIEKIRKTCMAIDGDIAGIGDEWLIVTPKFARIKREAE